MTARTKLVLGNWKMNGSVPMAEALLADVRAGASGLSAQLGVCPPFPYLGLAAARLAGSAVGWGAQDVAAHDDGAYTGEVSARMLAELGCTWTLVGHSERRTLFGDTDAEVARKTARAIAAGLVPVVCVGETREERESGRTEAVLGRQVDAVAEVLETAGERCVLAYEPVWAIGTGLTATPEMAQAAHAFLRGRLAERGIAAASRLQILYGGSMKPSNAAELLAQPDVDGGLIGGASLVAADFLAIVRAAAGRG
ncbi:MAG: triose-phosphate isomerase [Burkholderiales bacterium]|jgi:triosephosphate isomerase